jgi:hypothetical protein
VDWQITFTDPFPYCCESVPLDSFVAGNPDEARKNGYYGGCLHGIGGQGSVEGMTIEECAVKCLDNDFTGGNGGIGQYNELPLQCDAFEVYIPDYVDSDSKGHCHLQNFVNNKEFCNGYPNPNWGGGDHNYYYAKSTGRRRLQDVSDVAQQATDYMNSPQAAADVTSAAVDVVQQDALNNATPAGMNVTATIGGIQVVTNDCPALPINHEECCAEPPITLPPPPPPPPPIILLVNASDYLEAFQCGGPDSFTALPEPLSPGAELRLCIRLTSTSFRMDYLD